MKMIDVSVVIPTFRREREVREAIQSALGQEGVTVECIVLDDSPDGSARKSVTSLHDDRVTYIVRSTPSNGRPAVARNEGALLARGRYLHFLDDDDLLFDGCLRDLVSALDAAPDKGVAVGWVVPFGEDPYWLENKATYFKEATAVGASTKSSIWTVAHILFIGTIMVNSACMMRRECFAPLGGFDPSIPVYEDVDLWMRGIRQFGHVYVNRPVLHYRVGRPSLMHNLGKRPEAEVERSARMSHERYKRDHGSLEYRTLQILTKVLPFRLARQIPLWTR